MSEMPGRWNEWNQPKREVMWATNGKAIRIGLPKPPGGQMMTLLPHMLETELQDLMFVLLGFSLVLVKSFHVSLLSSLLEGECLLCAIISWKYGTFFLILQGLTDKSLP
jgi:hypothetical protein